MILAQNCLILQVKFLPDDTNFGGFTTKINKFTTGDQPQRVFIVFGLKPQDLSGCHYSNSTCDGETVFDTTFKLGYEEQEALVVSAITFDHHNVFI